MGTKIAASAAYEKGVEISENPKVQSFASATKEKISQAGSSLSNMISNFFSGESQPADPEIVISAPIPEKKQVISSPVSYTHLTLPTILLVQISVVAVSLKKKTANITTTTTSTKQAQNE
eukprot:TRINITY_DN8708_c0_g1_i5.p1 TRINITY_DN8708_c0_g1~~TRINITY_DN8708_c0_g1_i5.p1  ORF type:complete len:120 (-),score=34.09 TRINITY_DN8708_c0_g1_i5:19-378(-)